MRRDQLVALFVGEAVNSPSRPAPDPLPPQRQQNRLEAWRCGTGFDATRGGAAAGTFDADLAAELGSLSAFHAVQFTATGGLAGHVFEVTYNNGIAGYQAGQDMVIELVSRPADITTTATFL